MYGAERAVATSLDYTRYDRVVEAVGGKGFWVEQLAELGPALDEAFACGLPACVNVKIGSSDFRQHALSV
jgi:acetolactate synthase-1/2/3 large subunit